MPLAQHKKKHNTWSKWEIKQTILIFAKVRVSIIILYMITFNLSKIHIFKINLMWVLLWEVWGCLRNYLKKLHIQCFNKNWASDCFNNYFGTDSKTGVKRSFPPSPTFVGWESQPPMYLTDTLSSDLPCSFTRRPQFGKVKYTFHQAASVVRAFQSSRTLPVLLTVHNSTQINTWAQLHLNFCNNSNFFTEVNLWFDSATD